MSAELIARLESADGPGHKGNCHCYACLLAFQRWLDRKAAAALKARGV